MTVELRHITKRYRGRVAVDDVSLALAPGEIVGLVGPNGSGKTTLLRLAAGLLRPTSGETIVAAAATIRYFGGERTLPPVVRARRWLSLCGSRVAGATGQRLGLLSRGTRQRIGLEAALGGPARDLYLLDEPWEGLDPGSSRWLSCTLLERKRAGAAVFVSSHRIFDLADVCDRCAFLVGGRLSPRQVARETERADNLTGALYDAFNQLVRRA